MDATGEGSRAVRSLAGLPGRPRGRRMSPGTTLRPVAILEGTRVKVTSAQPQFLFPMRTRRPHTPPTGTCRRCARGRERLEVGAPASRPPGPRGLRSDSINIPPSSVAARGWRAGLRGWEQGIRARKAGGRALWAASVTRDPDRGVWGAGCAGWGDTHLESEPENSGSAE